MLDFDPADDIPLLAIVSAQSLLELRLRSQPLTGALVAVTGSRLAAYQLTCCLAREIGLILRPRGHDGAPIGIPAGMPSGPIPDANRANRPDLLRDQVAAARLVGSAAAGDAAMVRALALAVCSGRAPIDQARNVARAMLEIFALTPTNRSKP